MGIIRKLIIASIIVLAVSALIDFTLWYTVKFMVPCLTISLFSISYMLLLIALLKITLDREWKIEVESGLLVTFSVVTYIFGLLAMLFNIIVGVFLMSFACMLSWFALFIKDVEG